MDCGIFALVGTVLGACLTLLSKGELGILKKQKKIEHFVTNDEDDSTAKNESHLMRQWQNLLSYGVENENRAEV